LAAEVLQSPALDFDPYQKYGGVGAKPDYSNGYVVVMQHPVTTEYKESRVHIEETLHAISELDIPVFWFWPNVDAGADGTSSGIRSFREKNKLNHVHFFKNMEPNDFLRLIYNSKALIGNSSVGIRESAFLGVPVVNIGSRQNMRDRGANVIDVEYERAAILKAIETCSVNPKPTQDHVYGGGDAGKKIADLLASVPLSFHKTLAY
jgi:UDP-hydrolysing UDP-N-acetyl-D-glucosamine 2-epimerase